MKNILILIVVILVSGCTKITQVNVVYETTAAISEYNLQYMTPEGSLEKAIVSPESAQDVWQYSYQAEQGDIVWISAKCRDVLLNPIE